MADPLFPFPVRREGYIESNLLEFEEREGSLPMLVGQVGEPKVWISEGKKEEREVVPWKEPMVGEVDPRALVRKVGADLEEDDPEEATHLWDASTCRNRDQQEEPMRQSGLQGPWLGLRDLGEFLQPRAPKNPLGRSIRLVVLPAEGRPSASTCKLGVSPF